MKTLRTFSLLAILTLVLTSFNARTNYTSFEKALGEKKISIVIHSLGGHSGNCINIEVTNLTNKALNLQLEPGTAFVPEDGEEQTLVTAKEQLLVLDKKAVKTIKVFAYCTEASDGCPTKESKFQLSKTQNPKLEKLAFFLDSLKNADENLIQQAFWCVTDSHSISNVYSDDLKTTKALRSYLSVATGQKDTWYNTRRSVSVDANNRIINVAKEVKGELAFQATEPVELQGVVKDSTGAVIYTNPNKTNCPAGRIRFEFKLKVEGWAPGNYSVVYTNNGKEVLSQPFSF